MTTTVRGDHTRAITSKGDENQSDNPAAHPIFTLSISILLQRLCEWLKGLALKARGAAAIVVEVAPVHVLLLGLREVLCAALQHMYEHTACCETIHRQDALGLQTTPSRALKKNAPCQDKTSKDPIP